MLLKMPGINSKNIFSVLNKVEDFRELVNLELEKLTEILGSEVNAKLLHEFLHSEHTVNEADAIPNRQNKGKGTMFKGVKRKK